MGAMCCHYREDLQLSLWRALESVDWANRGVGTSPVYGVKCLPRFEFVYTAF